MTQDQQDLRSILADYGLQSGAGEYAKGQERLQHILTEAIVLIEIEGLKAFTMRGLARKADVSLALLQHYFKDRRAVLLAIARFFEHAYKAEITHVFDNPKLTIREKIEAFLDLHLRHPNQSSLRFSLFSESQTSSPGVAGPMMSAQDFAIDKISEVITPETPHLSENERKCRVAVMLATLHGMHFFYSRDPDVSPAPLGFRAAGFRQISAMIFADAQSS